MVTQMSGHHTLGIGLEERLLLRRPNLGGGGNLWQTNHIDNRLGQGSSKDVDNASFKSGNVTGIDGAEDDNGKSGGGKNSENGEKVNPGRRTSFHGKVLTDGIEGRAANTFGI